MTPRDVARALLWGPVSEARLRKAKRLLPTPESVQAMAAAVEELADADTAQAIRAGLARVGAL